MQINHIYGRSIADTGAMAALTQRTPREIRRYCTREEDGYDVDACDLILKDQPRIELVTAAEGARQLGIPVGTIYAWQSRKQLEAWQPKNRGRPLYDMKDLRRLAETRKPKDPTG